MCSFQNKTNNIIYVSKPFFICKIDTDLVKDVPDISLRFTKPHSQQFWTFDGDEIGLALVGNGFCQQCLTTTWWTIEQYTFGWCHTKFQELLWMLDRVLNQFLQFTFDFFKTTTIIPTDIGYLNDCFTKSRGIGGTHCKLKTQHKNYLYIYSQQWYQKSELLKIFYSDKGRKVQSTK